jgi:hypothetical protein
MRFAAGTTDIAAGTFRFAAGTVGFAGGTIRFDVGEIDIVRGHMTIFIDASARCAGHLPGKMYKHYFMYRYTLFYVAIYFMQGVEVLFGVGGLRLMR